MRTSKQKRKIVNYDLGSVLKSDFLNTKNPWVLIENPDGLNHLNLIQLQVLELKPTEQKDLIKFIELNAKKMWPKSRQQEKNTTHKSSVR